jgi:DNA processing protein
MMDPNYKIEIIYRLMKVKGIGVVKTNHLLRTIMQNGADCDSLNYCIEQQLSLDEKQKYRETKVHLDTLFEFPINYISILDNNYPCELKRYLSHTTPPVLSYIGNINLLSKRKVGFCGSRKVSAKGIAITDDCVKQLSNRKICVVSGYAQGVDLVAHETALRNGTSTIIVLPEGIECFKIKKELKNIWDWDRVLVISEFQPKDNWTIGRAMSRNSTIIGLSEIFVVIEAGNTGGSLDAGLKILKKGTKTVFVPQYKVAPESAQGNDILINNGAIPIKMKQDTGLANLRQLFELLDDPNYIGNNLF